MVELEIEAEASADLDDILRYSVEAFGEVPAGRYFDLIERTITRLRDFPESGTLYPRTAPPLRYASAGSHRIFYSRSGNRLTIHRVLHQAMRAQGRVAPR